MSKQLSQSGVAMIEVLITVVVISFGFMSLLSMQLGMLSGAATTNQQYLASTLAHNMGERMRANKTSFLSYNGLKTSKFKKTCNAGGSCTMAEQDLFQLKNALKDNSNALLNGDAQIVAAGGIATISLSWTEKQAKQQAVTANYSLQVSVE